MFSYLDRLRQKPEAVRRRYAFFVSALAVLIIAGLSLGFSAYKNSKDDFTSDTTPSPINALGQNIKDSFAATKESITANNPFAGTSSPDSVIISDSPSH